MEGNLIERYIVDRVSALEEQNEDLINLVTELQKKADRYKAKAEALRELLADHTSWHLTTDKDRYYLYMDSIYDRREVEKAAVLLGIDEPPLNDRKESEDESL